MNQAPKPVGSIPPFGLRMQPELKSVLEQAAKDNARSLNAEIISRLEDSLEESPLSVAGTARVFSAIERLEADLAAKDERLDETERLALMMASALTVCYSVTKAALEANPGDMSLVKNLLMNGMGAARTFTSNYKPKGLEGLVERVKRLKSSMEPEAYKEIVRAVTVSDETNSLVKGSEDRALRVIQELLDKHNIKETPSSLRFVAFAGVPPPSDAPVVRAEQDRRNQSEPTARRDTTAMTKGFLAEPGKKPKSPPPPRVKK